MRAWGVKVAGEEKDRLTIDVAARMREIREAVRSGSAAEPQPESRPTTPGSPAPLKCQAAGDGRRTVDLTAAIGFDGGGSAPVELSALRNRARALSKAPAFREFDFPSSIPLAGPVISAIRRSWNGISTRWFVRHAMLQQAHVNVELANLLDDTFRLLSDQGRRMLAIQEELDDVVAELEQSRQRQSLLERKLEELSAPQRAADPDSATAENAV